MPPARRRRSNNDNGPGLKIDLDGKSYVVRQSDISPHDVRALRKETGLSWAGLARELQSDPDIDLIAALIWLSRRIDGDEVSYRSILDEVSYDSDLEIGFEDKRGKKADEGDDSPEA